MAADHRPAVIPRNMRKAIELRSMDSRGRLSLHNFHLRLAFQEVPGFLKFGMLRILAVGA